MQVKEVELYKIKPYERNPRINEQAVEAVAASIDEFGFQQPLVVDSSYIIIVGHTRYKAAKRLKLKSVPVVVAEGLTDDQARAYRLADNKTGELAEWDDGLLFEELAAICDLDMEPFGFEDIASDIFTEIEEDEVPALDEENEPIVKSGEVWVLGEHRLMCGDSTKAEDVERLMNGALADLVVTDPPYNVDYEGAAGKIKNDSMSKDEFLHFLTAAFANMCIHLKAGGAFYVWHASREAVNFETALNAANLFVRQQIIWIKNTLVLSRQDYQWKHEPCFYGWKDGAAHNFTDDRSQTTVWDYDLRDLTKMTKEQLLNKCEEMREYWDRFTTAWREDKPARNAEHPTMKPVELFLRSINDTTGIGEIVLDLFGGSGTAVVACEQSGRICRVMEYDPRYCDVIIKRWESLTGRKAVREHEAKTYERVSC